MNNISKIFWIYILIATLLFLSCTNRNSQIGFPGTGFENYEILFDSSVFENIYTYRDSIDAYSRNNKLILGNHKGIDARILVRFINLPTDTTFVDNPIITLHISNKEHFEQEFSLKVGAIKDKIFLENFATWERFNETENWDKEGGDFDEPQNITTYVMEPDTLRPEVGVFRFEIDREIVKGWMRGTIFENYGLIFYSENAIESFIEFSSTETLFGPQISLNYISADSTIRIETRQANYDTFIHDKKDDFFVPSYDLVFSNIPPRSVYTKIDLSFESHKDIWKANEIEDEIGLRRINVTQAYIIFQVDKENTMMTNSLFNLSVGIPISENREIPDFKETFDFTKLWGWPLLPTTIGNIEDGEMRINISSALQQIISENRENTGFVMVNNQSNMDFSEIRIFNKEDNNEEHRPKLLLRYSILK